MKLPDAIPDLGRLRALQDEWGRRYGGKELVPKLLETLFDRQVAFVRDPAKRKLALCGRRSGKTTGVGVLMSATAMSTVIEPICIIPYVTLSRALAKRTMWPVLKWLNRKYRLGVEFNNTDLTATFSNGSQILLVGAQDEDDIEKLRGSAYPLAVIDECASFGVHLRPLIQEVLGPALSDYNGTLLMVGSPSMIANGPFYEASVGKIRGWSVHRWTVEQNPRFPRWSGKPNWQECIPGYLQEIREQNGWAESDPAYRREVLGEWVTSDTGLVYAYIDKHFGDGGNRISQAEWLHLREQHAFEYALGVDFGYDNPTAFSVVAWSKTLPYFYVVYGYRRGKMIPSEIASYLKNHLFPRYSFSRIVGDTGNLSKGYVEEFQRVHAIPIEAAEKTRKFEFVELLNDDFRTQRALVVDGQDDEECIGAREYIDELVALRRAKDYRSRTVEDERDPNDLCDATLYIHRDSYHYMHTPTERRPRPDTPEDIVRWEAQTMAATFEAVERAKRGQSADDWEERGDD